MNESVTVSAPLMPMVVGHLARLQTGLDFINTLDLWPVSHDHLDSPASALDWLVEHDLMHREARGHLLAQYDASPANGLESRLLPGGPPTRATWPTSTGRCAPTTSMSWFRRPTVSRSTTATRATRWTAPSPGSPRHSPAS